MKDFILSALPFVISGISVAVICTRLAKKKTGNNTYIIEGMLLGVAFGTCFGNVFSKVLGTAICTSLGMLVGEAIGSCIDKK